MDKLMLEIIIKSDSGEQTRVELERGKFASDVIDLLKKYGFEVQLINDKS